MASTIEIPGFASRMDPVDVQRIGCSESSLVIWRMKIQVINIIEFIKYLRRMNKIKSVRGLTFEFIIKNYPNILQMYPSMTENEYYDSVCKLMTQMLNSFNLHDCQIMKKYEEQTNHDVKACEYTVRDKFKENILLVPLIPFIHFPCTSEDVSNLAYNANYTNAKNVIMDEAIKLCQILVKIINDHKDTVCLSFTHGQPASPTTIGKKFAVMLYNLYKIMEKINNVILSGKWSGAVGNNNAINFCCPDIDYIDFARNFVESLGYTFIEAANQRNDHIELVELLNHMKTLSTIVRDISNNVWNMVTQEYIVQKVVAGETGSSVMPHKVNPWRFEESIGICQVVKSMFDGVVDIIPTQHERWLADHPWERNIGYIFMLLFAAIKDVNIQMERISFNTKKINDDLERNMCVLAEAGNILLRCHGEPDAYSLLKDLTRGNGTEINFESIIERIPVQNDRDRLMNLTPSKYIGTASESIDSVIKYYNEFIRTYNKNNRKLILLFDLDNTLFATLNYTFEIMREACKNLNIQMIDHSDYIREQKKNVPFPDLFPTLFGDNGKIVLDEYRRIAKNIGYTPLTGACEITQRIHNNDGRMFAVTNRAAMIQERLDQCKLNHVSTMFIDPTRKSKPSPDAISHIIDHFNTPYNCQHRFIMIGDHLDDYKCVYNYNLTNSGVIVEFYAVTTGLCTTEDFISAGLDNDYICGNLYEVYGRMMY